MPRIKLSPAEYRKLKEYVWLRDMWCLCCGEPFDATPHHVIFKSHGGNDSPNNLVRVCTACHGKIHRYELGLGKDVYKMLENEPERL